MVVFDIAALLFSSVSAVHLGLVDAVERTVGFRLPIVGCPKCLTFWLTLLYGCPRFGVAASVAISFLCAYAALWLELGMGYIDTLYNKIYEAIYSNGTSDTVAADSCATDTDSPLSDV